MAIVIGQAREKSGNEFPIARRGRGAGVSDQFPWYDSLWLTQFVRAKKFISLHHPARVAEFTRALEPLRTRPAFRDRLLDGFLAKDQVETILSAYRAVRRDQLELHELASHGRFVVHDHPLLMELHATLAADVGRLVGEDVEPSYSFLGMYNTNGFCDVHLDEPISKWTLDYCIEQSSPWPIAFSEVVPWPEAFEYGDADWQERIKSSSKHRFISHAMLPGQAVLFSGSSQWHFREPFADLRAKNHCSLLFLHFIPAGMKEVAEWQNWEAIFDVPGLTSALQ
jgi:hypothetical protein